MYSTCTTDYITCTMKLTSAKNASTYYSHDVLRANTNINPFARTVTRRKKFQNIQKSLDEFTLTVYFHPKIPEDLAFSARGGGSDHCSNACNF